MSTPSDQTKNQTLEPHIPITRTSLIPITFLTIMALLMMFPLVWMLSASLKVPATAMKIPPELWPYEWRFENYAKVMTHPQVPLLLFFGNSLKIAVVVTLGQLVTTTMAAYAFARIQFPARNIIFLILLSALMIPGQITLIPLWILMRSLGLIDTHAALIIPSITSIFGVFLLRQFFLQIPRELSEAAKVDGANHLRILVQIMIPLVAPALTTLAIITFVGAWNNFLGPLIFLQSWENFTWPQGIVMLRGQYGEGAITQQMAAVTLGVIPVMIFFIAANRKIIQAISMSSGIK